jgi:hypothetical protein
MRRLLRSALVVVLLANVLDAQVPDSLSHVSISIEQRRLWVIGANGDTVFSAPVAVGSGRSLRGSDRTWVFDTPRGETFVRAKEVAPAWIPPDWHYVELAAKLGLALQRLSFDRPTRLDDTTVLAIRAGSVGVMGRDSVFRVLPSDEEIIFGKRIFIPPFGTRNRRVEGVLGPYRLLLANGVGLHGTPYKESIGEAATHGCIRLHDEDITWLYEHVAIGTPVRIF